MKVTMRATARPTSLGDLEAFCAACRQAGAGDVTSAGTGLDGQVVVSWYAVALTVPDSPRALPGAEEEAAAAMSELKAQSSRRG